MTKLLTVKDLENKLENTIGNVSKDLIWIYLKIFKNYIMNLKPFFRIFTICFSIMGGRS